MSFEGLPKGAGNKQLSWRDSIYFWEIARGLGVTMGHLVRNIFHTDEMPTMQYPEEKRVYSDRFRGRHRLMQRIAQDVLGHLDAPASHEIGSLTQLTTGRQARLRVAPTCVKALDQAVRRSSDFVTRTHTPSRVSLVDNLALVSVGPA